MVASAPKQKPHLSSNLPTLKEQAKNLLEEYERYKNQNTSVEKTGEELDKWVDEAIEYIAEMGPPPSTEQGQQLCKELDKALSAYRPLR